MTDFVNCKKEKLVKFLELLKAYYDEHNKQEENPVVPVIPHQPPAETPVVAELPKVDVPVSADDSAKEQSSGQATEVKGESVGQSPSDKEPAAPEPVVEQSGKSAEEPKEPAPVVLSEESKPKEVSESDAKDTPQQSVDDEKPAEESQEPVDEKSVTPETQQDAPQEAVEAELKSETDETQERPVEDAKEENDEAIPSEQENTMGEPETPQSVQVEEKKEESDDAPKKEDETPSEQEDAKVEAEPETPQSAQVEEKKEDSEAPAKNEEVPSSEQEDTKSEPEPETLQSVPVEEKKENDEAPAKNDEVPSSEQENTKSEPVEEAPQSVPMEEKKESDEVPAKNGEIPSSEQEDEKNEPEPETPQSVQVEETKEESDEVPAKNDEEAPSSEQENAKDEPVDEAQQSAPVDETKKEECTDVPSPEPEAMNDGPQEESHDVPATKEEDVNGSEHQEDKPQEEKSPEDVKPDETPGSEHTEEPAQEQTKDQESVGDENEPEKPVDSTCDEQKTSESEEAGKEDSLESHEKDGSKEDVPVSEEEAKPEESASPEDEKQADVPDSPEPLVCDDSVSGGVLSVDMLASSDGLGMPPPPPPIGCPHDMELMDIASVDDSEPLGMEGNVAPPQGDVVVSEEKSSGPVLRDYQCEAVSWMKNTLEHQGGCVLADSDGLGKTAEVIAYIESITSSPADPHLIVVPQSDVQRWMSEIAAWSKKPSIVCEETNDSDVATAQGYVVVSYEVLVQKIAFLSSMKWDFMAVDDAHNLQRGTELWRALRSIKSPHVVLITGQPLRTGVGDLWTLLHFVAPGIFFNLDEFQKTYDFLNPKDVERMYNDISSFILMRHKDSVETSSPAPVPVEPSQPIKQGEAEKSTPLEDEEDDSQTGEKAKKHHKKHHKKDGESTSKHRRHKSKKEGDDEEADDKGRKKKSKKSSKTKDAKAGATPETPIVPHDDKKEAEEDKEVQEPPVEQKPKEAEPSCDAMYAELVNERQKNLQQMQQQQRVQMVPMMGMPMNPMMAGMQMNPMMTGMSPMGMQMNPMMAMNSVAIPMAPMNPMMQFQNPQMAAMYSPSMAAPRGPAPRSSGKELEIGKRPVEPEKILPFPEVTLPPEQRRHVETETSGTTAFLLLPQPEGVTVTKLSAETTEVTLGRHPDCNLQISRDEPSVSRFHAVVKCIPSNTDDSKSCKFVIRDTSTCGTVLNSTKLLQPLELEDGDRLFFGAAPFSLFFMRPNTCAKPSYEGILSLPTPGSSKRWSEKYCCIARDSILVFNQCNDSLPQAIIELRDVTLKSTKKPSHSWVVTVGEKPFAMAARTSDEKDAWLEAITIASGNARRNVLQNQALTNPAARPH